VPLQEHYVRGQARYTTTTEFEISMELSLQMLDWELWNSKLPSPVYT